METKFEQSAVVHGFAIKLPDKRPDLSTGWKMYWLEEGVGAILKSNLVYELTLVSECPVTKKPMMCDRYGPFCWLIEDNQEILREYENYIFEKNVLGQP